MTSGYLGRDPLSSTRSLNWEGTDVKLAYSYRGGVDTAGGNDLLLLCLHGAFCNRSDFNGVFTCSALRPYRLLAVDLPGHGESSKIDIDEPDAKFPAKMEEMAEVIWLLLGALELQGVATLVVGHSMGGTVGLLLADLHLGTQVRGFVSLEGVLVATDTPEKGIASRWMRKDPKQACALDLLEDIASAKHLGRNTVGLDHWRDAADKCGSSVHLLAVRMCASMVSWAQSGKLPDKLRCIPVFHYVYGTESGKFTEMLANALRGRKNCCTHAIHGAGHFLLLENLESSLGLIMAAILECTDNIGMDDIWPPEAEKIKIVTSNCTQWWGNAPEPEKKQTWQDSRFSKIQRSLYYNLTHACFGLS